MLGTFTSGNFQTVQFPKRQLSKSVPLQKAKPNLYEVAAW